MKLNLTKYLLGKDYRRCPGYKYKDVSSNQSMIDHHVDLLYTLQQTHSKNPCTCKNCYKNNCKRDDIE